MKNLKKLIVMSVLSLSICFVMLLGTTYAWMTDSVQSGKNVIQAGNLDAKLYHTNANVGTYTEVTTETKLFVDASGKSVKWEPGVFVYETFMVKNAGDLDMFYNLKLEAAANTYNAKNLSKVLCAKVVEEPTEINDELTDRSQLLKYFTIYPQAQALAKDGEKPVTVVIFWPMGETDKDYNIAPVEGDDSPLKVELKASLVACQQTEEGAPTLGAYGITVANTLKEKYPDNVADNGLISTGTYGEGEHLAITGNSSVTFNDDVTFENITFASGAKFKPTVLENGMTLTFRNCTFEADANGHCLDIDTCVSDDGTEDQNVNIVLKNCRFIGDNFATALSGPNADGLYINCGAGKFTGDVTIDKCTFEGIRDNAIDLGKFAGAVSIENCNFISWGVNSAQTGAAIKGEALTGGDLSANNLAFMLSKTETIWYVNLVSRDKEFVITRTNSSPIDMMNITSRLPQS